MEEFKKDYLRFYDCISDIIGNYADYRLQSNIKSKNKGEKI